MPTPYERGLTGLWGGVLCTDNDGDVDPVDLEPPPDLSGSRFLRLWEGGLEGRPMPVVGGLAHTAGSCMG